MNGTDKKNRTYSEIVRAYAKLSDHLVSRGIRTKFQILDNEASQAFQKEICTRNCDLQLVPPNMHIRNAAERAIITFNNHFVARICSAHA